MRAPIRLVAISAIVAACAPAVERPGPLPAWHVGSAPRLTIGASESDPAHELSNVSSARLHAGRLLIANSGSLELRSFDSTGKYLGASGRKGHGPGEFTELIYLFPAPGDSLYSFDQGNLRWSLHTSAGQFIRVLSRGTEAVPRPTWLYHRSVVESRMPGPVPAWVLGVLDGLPEAASGAPVRRARFDEPGYLWVADSSGNDWTVFADSALPIGKVLLPAGFRLLQAGGDFVLGVERDAMEQELVRVYALERPAGLPAPATGPPARFPPGQPAIERRLLANFRGLLMAQEVFYSKQASYSSRADSLELELASGSELTLLSGDNRHWAAVLYDRSSRTTCGISVGFPAPPGWLDGMPFCGR